jgi:hypothetical protein
VHSTRSFVTIIAARESNEPVWMRRCRGVGCSLLVAARPKPDLNTPVRDANEAMRGANMLVRVRMRRGWSELTCVSSVVGFPAPRRGRKPAGGHFQESRSRSMASTPPSRFHISAPSRCVIARSVLLGQFGGGSSHRASLSSTSHSNAAAPLSPCYLAARLRPGEVRRCVLA